MPSWQTSAGLLPRNLWNNQQGSPPLAAAQQLEYLSIGDLRSAVLARDEDWSAFWGWAARHPPLRRLGLEYWELPEDAPFHDAFLEELLLLWKRRPMLSVVHECTGHDELPNFADEALAVLPSHVPHLQFTSIPVPLD